MRVSKTLELSIPEDIDIDKLERYLSREMKNLGSTCLRRYDRDEETGGGKG